MTDTKHDTQDDGALAGVQARLRDGYDAVYDTTTKTTAKAIDTASDAARRATRGIESNPLGLLVGGIAVGAAVGALLPRSQTEKDLLAPIGTRMGTTARAALSAAKDAGRSELEARGLTKDAAGEQAKGLFDGVLKAIGSAGSAAKSSAATE